MHMKNQIYSFYSYINYCAFFFTVPDAPDGVTHGRGGSPLPDWLYDYYHPLEKAQYPTYFATREKRKKEFMQWYDRTYGRPTKIED